MSFIGRIFGKFAGSSSPELQKIKDEAEQRRASKSNSAMPKIKGGVEGTVVSMLEKRIKSSEFSTKDLKKS